MIGIRNNVELLNDETVLIKALMNMPVDKVTREQPPWRVHVTWGLYIISRQHLKNQTFMTEIILTYNIKKDNYHNVIQ